MNHRTLTWKHENSLLLVNITLNCSYTNILLRVINIIKTEVNQNFLNQLFINFSSHKKKKEKESFITFSGSSEIGRCTYISIITQTVFCIFSTGKNQLTLLLWVSTSNTCIYMRTLPTQMSVIFLCDFARCEHERFSFYIWTLNFKESDFSMACDLCDRHKRNKKRQALLNTTSVCRKKNASFYSKI